jgi:hypothetical protein
VGEKQHNKNKIRRALKLHFFSKEGQERKNEIGKRKTGNGTEGREWEILTKNN